LLVIRLVRAIGVVALLVGAAVVPAVAQTGQLFGEIVGKVVDEQGAILPGVTSRCRDPR
jgi:hypothetical protein